MGRITGNTKEIINNYYKEKLKVKHEESLKIENEIIKKQIEKFENDNNVLKVKELLKIINEKYNVDMDITLPRYRVKYELDEKYIEKLNEMKEIRRERDELVVVLDNLPKNSKEYKYGISKLNSILKGE